MAGVQVHDGDDTYGCYHVQFFVLLANFSSELLVIVGMGLEVQLLMIRPRNRLRSPSLSSLRSRTDTSR